MRSYYWKIAKKIA